MSHMSRLLPLFGLQRPRRDENPLVDVDLTAALPPAVTFRRAGGNDSSIGPAGQLRFATATDEPAFDHRFNAATGLWEAAGLLLRPVGTTNLIPNSDGIGASGTTLPNGWTQAASTTVARTWSTFVEDGFAGAQIAINANLIGSGAIAVMFAAIPLRVPGNPDDDDYVAYDPATALGVALGDAVALGAYLRLVSGAWSSVSASLFIREYDAAGTSVGETSIPVAPNAAQLARQFFSVRRTLSVATVATVRPGIRIAVTPGRVDMVLRIGVPNFQIGNGINGVIRTAGSPASRAGASATLAAANGRRDLLIDGDTTAWRDRAAITGGAWPITPNSGERRVRRVRGWRANYPSIPFRRRVADATLPPLVARLRADQGDMILVNGRVSSWAGEAGVSADQSDAASRPLLVTTPQGPAVRFEGAPQFLNLNGVTYDDNMTILLVMRANSDAERQTVLGHRNFQNAFNLEINTVGSSTLAAFIPGITVAASVALPTLTETNVVAYSRRGTNPSDEGASPHVFGINTEPDYPAQRDLTNSYSVNTNKEIGRRNSGLGQYFTGDIHEIRQYRPALSPDQLRLVAQRMRADWGIELDATQQVSTWAGALTDTGFVVCSDLTAPSDELTLVVSRNADLSLPDFVSAAVGSTSTASPAGYLQHAVRLVAAGLQPATRYYYAVANAGAVDASQIRTLVTAPARGQPASYRVAFGSCTNVGPTSDADTLPAVAAENPLMLIHMGDLVYTNVAVDDLAVARQNTRRYRSNPKVDAAHRSMPIAYIFDNHDAADPHIHWDEVMVSGASPQKVVANARRAILETAPLYPLAQTAATGSTDPASTILAQQWDIGRTRYLMPDMISQFRYAVGTPTMLGHTSGHEYWDQFSWLLAALRQAGTDGIKLVFLVLSHRWQGLAVHDAWVARAPAELTALCDWIRDQPGVPAVVVLNGDVHFSGADDGTNTDKSAGGGGRFPVLTSSPMFSGSVGSFESGGAQTWNGVANFGWISTRQYALLDVTDNGGDDVSWTCTFKHYDRDAEAVVYDGQASSHDAPNLVSLPGAAATVAAGGTLAVTLQKTWFGPVGGCAVEWVASHGPSGTVPFRPNSNRATFTVPAPAVAGSFTLTLRNPVRCVLGTANMTVSVS